MPDVPDPSAVVLVEGESDRAAVLTLAERRGRHLETDGVVVIAMGGITNIGRYLSDLDRHAVLGLYDAGEERVVANALARLGHAQDLGRAGLQGLGFYVCVEDLEDELIRALGPDRVIEVIEDQGEMATFRRMRNQPAQRERPLDRQLRRFIGTRSGRKIRYGRLLVEALEPDRVPTPLDGLLSRL
ncbi:MAG TPA: TOPRIM nucleotidyl transferase/hydrolase domain-containing protein [Acidimicrobiia bacterium]|nr:TOPRIM nucleotidyl transferase/hydrolase domain-containing protein [Acidimicrobiia bacterium]